MIALSFQMPVIVVALFSIAFALWRIVDALDTIANRDEQRDPNHQA